MPNRYFIINKPYNMVSQFVSPDNVKLLGNIKFDFPEGTHAIGRLDSNSEGLLILTTNKKVTRLLFESKVPHKRAYLIMVRGVVSEESLLELQTGVKIPIEEGKEYLAVPTDVMIVTKPEEIYNAAATFNERGPHSWLLMTLTEGKFHQVRKMVGAIRHRCKRLIRVSIEDLQLGDLAPGKVLEMEEADFFEKLKITDY